MPTLPYLLRRGLNPTLPLMQLAEQWSNPSDVFSVLLILGGDVVAGALAQLVGSGVTPVAFSFGMYNSSLSSPLRPRLLI